MTPQTIMRVDATEVPSLEIACTNCGSVIAIKLPKQNIAHDATCIGCNTLLWSYPDPSHTLVLGIVRTLSAWKETKGAPFTLGFSLRLDASGRASGGKD
jgi:hypothetical protein